MFWIFLLIFGLLGVAVISFTIGRAFERQSATDMMRDIVGFHEKFGLEYNGPPRILPVQLFEFREGFMREELDEYVGAQIDMFPLLNNLLRNSVKIDQQLELQLDALVDLTYVVLGTAYLQFGPEVFMEAWRRVHVANMQKVRRIKLSSGHVGEGTGFTDSGRAPEFDVVKPDGWTAPSHLDLIQNPHNTEKTRFEERMVNADLAPKFP